VKIISMRKFVMRILWNNGEIRDIDFKPIIADWKENNENLYAPLFNSKIFNSAAISEERTLHWPDVKISTTYKGVTKESALDIDPDVLFEKSKLVEAYQHPHIGLLFKAARERAGLSQTQVAKNSGTSRNYISRIENEQSDIQVETLFKIVKLGIGKELKVSIE